RPFTHLLPCQKFPTFWPKFLPVVNRVAVRSPRRLTVNQADVRNLGNEIAISKSSGFVGPTITRRVSRWASQPLHQLIPHSSRKPEEETFLPRPFLSAFISSLKPYALPPSSDARANATRCWNSSLPSSGRRYATRPTNST